jgi:collagenase-like PrtC family protease
MPGTMLAAMPVPAGMQTELFAYGRLPLAHSARCFTARHYDLPKDDCQFRCLDHPDGLVLRSREGQDFLAINGVQIQSAKVLSLAHRLAELRERGVDILRLSPQARYTERVVGLYRGLIDGEIPPAEAPERLKRCLPAQPCDGYWRGKAGMDWLGPNCPT